MSLKQKLIDFIDRRFYFKASDADYEYSAAIYHRAFDSEHFTEDERKFIKEYEQLHPVDAIDRREEIDKLKEKKRVSCFDTLKFVKPNRHVGEDIFSHPFKSSYEHQDENGNWVEGPALGHGYEGGYDCSFNPDTFSAI
jgi:hypothetical protein